MPEPGDLIGPYRVVSELGKGAMGEVWRARDERLDRYVALKILPADAAGDVERRARMLREARAAAAIRHISVVTLFDVVAHNGDDILVMELVEGRTLSEALRKDGPPTLAVALRWIEDVADALAAAHARGILHRDIKSANIMVTADGGIKVLDFGLAKLRDGDQAFVTRPPPTRVKPAAPANAQPIALDATMPSGSGPMPASTAAAGGKVDGTAPPFGDAAGRRQAPTVDAHDQTAPADFAVPSYRTHAGHLLGTPLYMAPEQVEGGLADERSEVFAVGVLAHEILAGKPPYTAASMDELFREIATAEPPPLPKVPPPVVAVVLRALAKAPDARWQSMRALRDAIAAERRRLFAPRSRRWPLAVAAGVIALGVIALAWWWTHRAPPPQPGDAYVQRALEEYDVFYNEKALSSLRAAVSLAPDHPRANAYVILFGSGSPADRASAVAAAERARATTPDHSKDGALLAAAIALAEQGPGAARAALTAAGATDDRELAFWAAELDYRAGQYTAAHDEYKALLAEPAPQFRGRIYDHDSSVLLYLDRPDEALRIGTLYRDAFPGEADAVGVYATTLSAAGQHDAAIAAAEEAVRLNEGEDTLAGLAKVLALAGNHARAKELYRRSVERAGPARRPIRRAALALLQWIDGDSATARATVAPCLHGGSDALVRERGQCLFVAGIVDPAHALDAAAQLDALARDATPAQPAYGVPAALAAMLRARVVFFGGGCVVDPKRADVAAPTPATVDGRGLSPAGSAAEWRGGSVDVNVYTAPLDFYGAYHLPFFASWAVCEHAAYLAAHGDRAGAAALLAPVATRAPNRTWLLQAVDAYR